MATIHHTTMVPTELELLAAWLPRQTWSVGEVPPALSPAGEVGIELMLVTDGAGSREITYFVPLAYRGAPVDGAEDGLVGTSEPGVLGTGWIHDAAHEPVAVTQLLAFLTGSAAAQQPERE
jgi:hypothetical protein